MMGFGISMLNLWVILPDRVFYYVYFSDNSRAVVMNISNNFHQNKSITCFVIYFLWNSM